MQSFAEELGDKQIDANQEMFALGLANVLGAFFQSFAVTGGLSRTAVSSQVRTILLHFNRHAALTLFDYDIS